MLETGFFSRCGLFKKLGILHGKALHRMAGARLPDDAVTMEDPHKVSFAWSW
jgi:hypothetical protein